MSNKSEATREQARQILKNGILDMSIARLIQMAHFGLKGNIELSNGSVSVQNVFNRISYDEEKDTITFSIEETESSYGAISIIHKPLEYGKVSFFIGSIEYISGCEDAENPEEWLNINIQMADKTAIKINILY